MNDGSFYTQGVGLMEPPIGSYYDDTGVPASPLAYPNQEGSSYLSGYGDATSYEPTWGYGNDAVPAPPPPELPPSSPPTYEVPKSVKYYTIGWGIVSTASMAASAYHGYKRNQSIGWAVAWGLLGGMFPVLVPVIAVAQGYGKPKRGR